MVYEPAEDSFLVRKEVEKLARGDVLDIGTGSGIQAKAACASKRVKSVLGVDIDPAAVMHCRKFAACKKCSFIVSDLFSKVLKKKFDTIIFNPPYLPEQEGEDSETALAVAGGKKGYEVVERFLSRVNDFLAEDGQVLLLFSTLTGKEKVESMIAEHLLEFEELSRQEIAFEQLYVYLIKKTVIRKALEKKGVLDIITLTKGHRGMIFTGKWKGNKVTIKIQRKDIAAKDTINNEVKQLSLLNRHNIGPKLLFFGNDFFVYQFVDGIFIRDYFGLKTTTRKDVFAVLKDVFEQMFILDHLKVNKMEMNHPYKHVLVTKNNKVVLLDFERCKQRGHVKNVTQFVQFVVSMKTAPLLELHDIKLDKSEWLKAAKKYSDHRTRENFDTLIELLK